MSRLCSHTALFVIVESDYQSAHHDLQDYTTVSSTNIGTLDKYEQMQLWK